MASSLDPNSISRESDNEIDHLINHHPFFQNTDYSQDKLIYFYNHIDSIIQKGPTCGLVVLLMAERLINHELSPEIDLERLLAEARKLNLTNNGEMFTANGIEILAKNVLKLKSSTLNCMQSNRALIIKNLFECNAILIPYDTDANHEPCLKKGKKAHWCITTGCAFRISSNRFNEMLNESDLMERPIIDLKSTKLKADDLIRLVDESSDLSLLCKQGKSKHLKLFQFDELVKSNKNLYDVDDSKDSGDFVIPEEGIGHTLCDKFVLINH